MGLLLQAQTLVWVVDILTGGALGQHYDSKAVAQVDLRLSRSSC